MRDKLSFAALTVAASIVLYAMVRGAMALGWPIASWDGFVIPVLAMMIAALGVGWKRKIVFLVGTAVGFVLIEAVASLSGVATLVSQTSNLEQRPAEFVGGFLYSSVVLAYPLAVLVLFVGRRPAVLWERHQTRRAGR